MQQATKESHDPFVLVSVHGLRIDLRKGTMTFPGITSRGKTSAPLADHSAGIEAERKTLSPLLRCSGCS